MPGDLNTLAGDVGRALSRAGDALAGEIRGAVEDLARTGGALARHGQASLDRTARALEELAGGRIGAEDAQTILEAELRTLEQLQGAALEAAGAAAIRRTQAIIRVVREQVIPVVGAVVVGVV